MAITDASLLDAQVQAKRIYSQLNEVMDLSRQLADALDRNDQITVQIVLSMREEPIKRLRQARAALEEQRDSLPPESRERLSALLNGAPAETKAEEPLAGQVGANQRLLKQVLDLDQILNRKLTREKSIYESQKKV